MNDFIKQHFKSITVGIISSVLFLYLFQPILDFIGDLFLELLSYTGSKYSDDFYSKIAHLELLDFSFYWIAIIFGGVAFAAGAISLRGFVGLFRKNDFSKKESDDKNKKQRIAFYLLNIFFSIFIILFLSTKVYQLKLISSFKQHMRVIAPYITEQTEEELYSQWSLMSNSNDYDAIYFRLRLIASKNQLELPENKIYSLTSF